MVKRWILGMDFQGGSPEAEAEEGECFYPRYTKFVLASDYDALQAELMSLSQDDGKVERALESAQARIRELEAAIRMVIARTYNPWVIHKLFDALNGEKRAARHKVTCKLFPDPFDERDPVGPCTCSPLSDATHDQGDDLARERRCNCGWPRTTDGEHGNNCPVATQDRGGEHG
jgi:hypothetical protein